MGRSLLSRAKTSEFQKGIFNNVVITNIDTKDRKGQNGPINKMVYIKFAQLNESGKKLAESELAWWKPDITSEYFKVNFQEICLQMHNIVESYLGEDKAFDAFSKVFDVIDIPDLFISSVCCWIPREARDPVQLRKETSRAGSSLNMQFVSTTV